MRIARPMSLIFVIVLALVLPHGASDVSFAQTECVQPLDSVAVEGAWNGDCLSRSREDAYARYYTFSILQQSDVSITLESETDPYLFLLSGIGADADYLAENDDIDASSRNFNSRVAITLEPGDYTIEASTYEQPATGDFTLTVRGVGPLDDRAVLLALYNVTGGDKPADLIVAYQEFRLRDHSEWPNLRQGDSGMASRRLLGDTMLPASANT